jgi:hypothetical protein
MTHDPFELEEAEAYTPMTPPMISYGDPIGYAELDFWYATIWAEDDRVHGSPLDNIHEVVPVDLPDETDAERELREWRQH